MVSIKIGDQTKSIEETNLEWIRRTISRNRVTGSPNSIEIEIDSENAHLKLFANVSQTPEVTTSNEIEDRILFLWQDLVLSKQDVDADSLYDFINRMDHWISFQLN
ncbi:MAG: hypothetical protein WEA56_14210 [Balneolaceae bacterium]